MKILISLLLLIIILPFILILCLRPKSDYERYLEDIEQIEWLKKYNNKEKRCDNE